MKTTFHLFSAVTKEAYSRLKEWFDPSFEGSPYEDNFTMHEKVRQKKSYLMSKRLSIKY